MDKKNALQPHNGQSYEIQANSAINALPGSPGYELGQRLNQISSSTMSAVYQAQENWWNSGRQDHTGLDAAIQSLSQIADPLEQYHASVSTLLQFMQRTDFPFADVSAVVAICPAVMSCTDLVKQLTSAVGDRISFRQPITDYSQESAFLSTITNNQEDQSPDVLNQAQFFTGEIIGLQLDKKLKLQRGTTSFDPVISSQKLIEALGVSPDLTASIDTPNTIVWETPVIIADLSREAQPSATRFRLQGIAIGIAQSMLSRRPELAFPGTPDGDLYTNLTTAAFNTIAHLHDPQSFNLMEWINKDYQDKSPLHQIVVQIDQQEGRNGLWFDLLRDQANLVRDNLKPKPTT